MIAVMISIQPKWCTLISSGKKTIEVRKTKPKLDTPFKCYVYRTFEKYGDIHHTSGKVIGEFICDTIYKIDKDSVDFIFKTGNESFYFYQAKGLCTCMENNELLAYMNFRQVYGWHVSNLVIYDKPKKLSEFHTDRPPQSWMYVNEVAE